MATPNVIVVGGRGINCEEETAFAFRTAGARAEIVSVDDLIDKRRKISDCQILAFPGGFSYGDDTGAGNALAHRLRHGLWDELRGFVGNHGLMIGICNGFQVMVNLGLLPAVGGQYGLQQAALVYNDSARYFDRWVDLDFFGESPWIKGIGRISLPIAHCEGKFYAPDEVLAEIQRKRLVAARYVEGRMCRSMGMQANPNGSLDDIAAITDETGRLIGMMPHAERAIAFTHRPDWTLLKEAFKRGGIPVPEYGEGLAIFRNGVEYFK